MSLPTGYVQWAESRGANAYHPATWTPDDHRAFGVWKLAWFREKWGWLKRRGLLSGLPRDLLRSRIREDLDRLHAAPPSRPYRVCPCHRLTTRRDAGPEPTHGLTFIETFRPAPRS